MIALVSPLQSSQRVRPKCLSTIFCLVFRINEVTFQDEEIIMKDLHILSVLLELKHVVPSYPFCC